MEDIVGENEEYDSYFSESFGEPDFDNANKYHIPVGLTNYSDIGVVVANNSSAADQQNTFSH